MYPQPSSKSEESRTVHTPAMRGNRIPRNPPEIVREAEVLNERPKLALGNMLNNPVNAGENPKRPPISKTTPITTTAEEEEKKLKTTPDAKSPNVGHGFKNESKWAECV